MTDTGHRKLSSWPSRHREQQRSGGEALDNETGLSVGEERENDKWRGNQEREKKDKGIQRIEKKREKIRTLQKTKMDRGEIKGMDKEK